MQAARERASREECDRAISSAYKNGLEALCRNGDTLVGFGVSGLAALGFLALLRKPRVTQPTDGFGDDSVE